MDWYSHHGSPEERLKAWMYLGTEQFISGQYNLAIVSYIQASEQSYSINDQNLQGVLYSKMAETFTKSQEYVQANDYLDKAITCFENGERYDQLTLARIMKAVNLMWMMEWDEAEDLFNCLLSDCSLSNAQKGSVEGYYAMMKLYNPSVADTASVVHFKNTIDLLGGLEEVDQFCAYAYILGYLGQDKESASLFDEINLSDYGNRYSYNYWKHRLHKNKGDYKNAYNALLSAKTIVDSITRVNLSLSASRAQNTLLEDMALQRRLKIQSQRRMFLVITLVIALAAVCSYFLYKKRRRRLIDERDRKEITIELLNHQLNQLTSEKNGLIKEKTKARFAMTGAIFEDAYHLMENEERVGADISLSVYHEDDIIPVRQENSMKSFLDALPLASDTPFSGSRQADYDGEIIYAHIKGRTDCLEDRLFATLSSAGMPSNMYIGVTDADKVRFLTNNIYGDREIVCEFMNVDMAGGTIEIESPFIGAASWSMPMLPMSDAIYPDLASRKLHLRSGTEMKLEMLTSLLRHREDLLLEAASFRHYHLDDYERFPSVREVLTEIIPNMLALRKVNGGYKLVMLTTDATGLYKEYVDNVLVMMDGVVISDIGLLLDFDAMLIEDIDIYTQAVVCGKVLFSGVVNFITKKNYVTTLPFPDNVKVIDFKGVSYPVAYYGEVPPDGEDTRELLYWDPVLKLAPGESKRLVLHTPGYSGRFRAVVEGLASDGTPVHHEWTFEVE